jgi:hypothetical protein
MSLRQAMKRSLEETADGEPAAVAGGMLGALEALVPAAKRPKPAPGKGRGAALKAKAAAAAAAKQAELAAMPTMELQVRRRLQRGCVRGGRRRLGGRPARVSRCA